MQARACSPTQFINEPAQGTVRWANGTVLGRLTSQLCLVSSRPKMYRAQELSQSYYVKGRMISLGKPRIHVRSQ